MKRAGIIFCVLAVLAVGWMTAANIAVGAVAEDVRFESELRAARARRPAESASSARAWTRR